MFSVTDIEKVKNPIVAAFLGIIIGVAIAGISLSFLYEVRVKNLELNKIELEHKISIQEKSISDKEIELISLQSKLVAKPTFISSANKVPSAELRNYIAQLDNEIYLKKRELARNGALKLVDFSGTKETPKSEEYIRIEKELESLSEQRNLAAKKLIETLATK